MSPFRTHDRRYVHLVQRLAQLHGLHGPDPEDAAGRIHPRDPDIRRPPLYHHPGRERDPRQLLYQHPQEPARGDLPLHQDKQRQIPQTAGMQVRLLSEQGRLLYRIFEDPRQRSAHFGAQIRRSR